MGHEVAYSVIFGLILSGILVGIIFASLTLQEWEDRLAQSGIGGNSLLAPHVDYRFSPDSPAPRPRQRGRDNNRHDKDDRNRDRDRGKDGEKNLGQAAGLILSGFDTGGTRLRMPIERRIAERSKWGVTFGRDGGVCDYVISDGFGALSRRHFRVSWNGRDQCYQIEDLNSAAGTKVNGRQLKPFEKVTVPLPAKIDVGGRVQLDLTRS
jgi:hypothetical protein